MRRGALKLPSLIAGLTLGAGIALVACGGGESGPPLNVYFDSIEPAFMDISERLATSRPLLEEKLAAAQSEEERGVVLQEGVDNIIGAYSSLAVQLRQVEPAGKAKDAQEELIAATQGVIDPLQTIFDSSLEAQAGDDLSALIAQLDGPEVTGAMARQAEACLKLQAVAEENELNVDLACRSD